MYRYRYCIDHLKKIISDSTMTTSTNFKIHLETATKNFFEGVKLKEEQVNALKAFYEAQTLSLREC